ncbi:SCP domain-containing protein [Mycena chlorophos]|uniref:SCP domain-containing protein n=1 Tax=Mycena chlorophos TaxID=658473 RepID=A0A8H6TIL9_MYCCL|nr:SCP domain-containing protein [Mycena chlorophos]
MQNLNQHPVSNRQIISETLDFYLSLLHVASTIPGQPNPFEETFPLVDRSVLVTQRAIVSRRGRLSLDFTINFRNERGALVWWIRFDGLTLASLTIAASTMDLLREWSPSPTFVLCALRASLWQRPEDRNITLAPTPFTISTLGRVPAQELSLLSPTGIVVVQTVLYRCVTRRCGRVFAPGSRCNRH